MRRVGVTGWLLDADPAITLQTLQLLRLDPASPAARRAGGLVAENGRWGHAGRRRSPSRWNTLRSLRVLAWWDAAAPVS